MIASSTLYQDRHGRVNCGTHAPYMGTTAWILGKWKRVPGTIGYGIHETIYPTGVACETCRATAGPSDEPLRPV